MRILYQYSTTMSTSQHLNLLNNNFSRCWLRADLIKYLVMLPIGILLAVNVVAYGFISHVILYKQRIIAKRISVSYISLRCKQNMLLYNVKNVILLIITLHAAYLFTCKYIDTDHPINYMQY